MGYGRHIYTYHTQTITSIHMGTYSNCSGVQDMSWNLKDIRRETLKWKFTFSALVLFFIFYFSQFFSSYLITWCSEIIVVYFICQIVPAFKQSLECKWNTTFCWLQLNGFLINQSNPFITHVKEHPCISVSRNSITSDHLFSYVLSISNKKDFVLSYFVYSSVAYQIWAWMSTI